MLSLTTVMLCFYNDKAIAEIYTKVLGEPGWSDDSFTGWQAGPSWLMIGEHSEVKGRSETPARIMLNFDTADVIIVLVLLLFPVLVIMSGAVASALIGEFLFRDGVARNEGSELLELDD